MLFKVELIKKCKCKSYYTGEWEDIMNLFLNDERYISLEILELINEN